MKKIIQIPLLFLFFSTLLFSQQIVLDDKYFEENREAYFSFSAENRGLVSDLSRIISVDKVKDGKVYAYANKNEYNKFLGYSVEHQILRRPGIVDYPVKMSSSAKAAMEWDSYPTYDAYVDMMYQFEADYPGLCEIIDAGTTVQGRKILFAKISDNIGSKEAEPQFMYTSTMHGDETTGYVLMLRLIDYLLSNYGTDAEVTNLVNNLEIWINPNHNPDGTYHSGNNTVSGATRYNGNSVDINRNFADPEDGPHPDGNAYQPETTIMMNLAQENNFVLSANFHGGAEVVNYPWDTWAKLHPDNNWFVYLSRGYADTVHANAPSNYMNEYNNGITNGYAWYEVSGGRQDYYTYFAGGREVTIELSDTKLLSASQLPAHWDYNKRSLLNYMKESLNGFGGIVTGNTGDKLKATIKVTGHDADNSEVFSDSLTGRYERMIYAGTYDVEVSADDYFTKTINNVTVQNGQFTELNVELISEFGEPDTVAPAAITDLSATDYTSNSITIGWTVPLDESAGGVQNFDVRYSASPINNDQDFENATVIEYNDTPGQTGEYESVTKEGLTSGTTYYFAVKSEDIWHNVSNLSNVVAQATMAAPEISVSPASLVNEINVNSTVTDTIFVANVTTYPSTLDFTAELADDVLKNSVKVNVVPVVIVSEKTAKTDVVKGGGVSVKGSGGPDAFGYEWIDSDDPNGPEYVWEDISTTGTPIDNWSATGTLSATDEGKAGPVDLGFEFKFYGEVQTSVYLSTNGYLSFNDISGSTYTNSQLPSSATPNNIISAFWDDLDKKTAGHAYVKNETNRTIIQYTDWSPYSGSGSYTFQYVLYKNGKIVIYYNNISASASSATTGIENANGTIGLQVAYNSAYAENGKALEISAAPEWVAFEGASGTIFNGNNAKLGLEFTSEDLEEGTYNTNVVITSNDPANSTVSVPVTLIVGTSGVVSATVSTNAGWNLVSVPVLTGNMDVDAIFPDAVTTAYAFNNGYVSTTELENKAGYWLKFNDIHNYIVSGSEVTGTISVNEGWNIIGGNDESIDINSITTNPAGIISSSYYGYEGFYNQVQELVPGKGYWVKASAAGELTIGSSTKKSTATFDAEGMTVISVSNGKNSTNLYMGESGYKGSVELPPLPPAGFDVRFSGDVFATGHNSETVYIKSEDYPVVIKAVTGDINVNGMLIKAGEEYVIADKGTESVTVTNATVPEEYSLGQNYPNPFNPSTKISFALPVESKVTITVYNMLGQKVEELVNGMMSAGQQEVELNAGSFASGMYIYNISAKGADGRSFTATKKMMLMK